MMKYLLLAFCLCFLAGFVAAQNLPQYNLTTVVGLANATAGVNSYFTIQLVDASGKPTTYCPPSNPFKITVSGKYPANGAIAVCDSGRYRASWSSTVAGAYNITVSATSTTPAVTLGPYQYFNLPGPIYPPTCNTTGNTAGGVAGQTFTFNIIARDQYGNLNTACTPSIWSVVLSSGGTVVRGAVSSTCPAPGQYRVTYAPTVKGSYSMVVSANGYNIMGSPFTVNIAPGFFNAANSVVSPIGPTIEAGEELIFTVTSYDANKNPITICYPPQSVQWNNTLQLAGHSVAQINGYGNPNCTKGVYQFRFSETRASPNYFVSVTVNGTAVGSKTGLYPLSIQPSSVISAPFSLAAGVGLFNGVAGLPSLINITAFDQYDNVITDCEVTAPQNFEFALTSLYSSNLTCSGLGQTCIEGDFSSGVPAVFQGSWYCDVATNYSLQISYQGDNFNQTYYPSVRPGVLSGPFSTAFGPGTLEAYAGQQSVIYVDPFDQYQNPIPTCDDVYFVGSNFSVQVTNNSGASLQGHFNNCVQTGSGPNITLVYTLTSIYVTDLQVQYNGQNLYPGTFSLETYPGPPGAGKCHANGTGLSSATAGVRTYFSVWCTDAYDNLISQCLPYANWYANLTSEADGTVTYGNAFNCENTTSDRAYTFFEYTLYKSGQYDLDYGYLEESNNDPHVVTVVPGPLDIANTIAEGYGVEGQDIPAGSNVSFTVYARDQYGNALQTCLNISDSKNPDVGLSFDFYPSNASYFSGPYVVPCDPTTGNYNVTVYYTTTLADEYSVDVRYNDKAIHRSPYSPIWVAGPIDRSHIVAWGDEKAHSGLRFGIAGVTAFFYVNVSDQYNNRVEDCTAFQESDWTVTLNKINGTATVNGFVFACDNRTGIRQANYTATVSGIYNLDLQYQSGAVPGAYTPTIYPGPDDDSMALVWGPGVDESHNVVAGVSEILYVTPRDYYGNNLTHCSTPAITYTATLVPPPNTTANVSFTSGLCDPNTFDYTITYTVYLADKWQVYVRGRQNLSNDHADMTVVPAPIYAPHTNASQPQGYTQLVAGQDVTVNLAVSDLYYNNITDCSYSNNSAWSIYAVPVNNKSMHYYASAVQCNDGVLSATYSVRAYGTYNVYVTYYKGSARNSGYVSTFVAGTVSPGDSYAVGAGVNGTENVAGVLTSFTIYVANEYGIPITDGSLCSQFNLSDWAVVFDQSYSWNDSSVTTAPVVSCNEVSGSFYGRYLPTRARVYSVDISLKGQSIAHVPYNPEVIPAAVYPPYTVVYGLNGTSGDNGTFYLQTQDRFHNNEIYTNKNNFNITLSPTCTETTITTRDAGNGTLEVDYSVTEGGVYCVSISYQGVFYPVLDSTIHAIGGTGCNSSCSTKGYCFKNYSPSTSDAEYSCNCFQGWTGDDCSVKMSSRYPLAIGAVVGLIIGLGILMFIIGLILGFFVFRFLRRGDDHHALLD